MELRENIDRNAMLQRHHQLQAAAQTMTRIVGAEDLFAAQSAFEIDIAKDLRSSGLYAPSPREVEDGNSRWAGQSNVAA